MIPDEEPRAPLWPLRAMAVVLLALGVVPMANLVAPGAGLAWWAPSVRLWIVWSTLAAIVALVIARALPDSCDAIAREGERLLMLPSSRSFAALVGVATTLLALFFAWHLFRMQPVTIDELSMQWQAGLLTGGRLFARAEPRGEFFGTMQTMVVDGRWFAHFPIGAPALLAVGSAIGAPWIVNPVLAGIAVVVLHAFVRRTTGERDARVVALLFMLSPFVLFMAASQLDHVGALVAVWTAIASLPGWLAAESASDARRRAVVIGAAFGVAATIRPYDAVLIALVVGVFQLAAVRRRPALASSLLAQVLAGLLPVALLLAVNGATTGHPFTFGYEVLNGPEHGPGFHIDPFGEMHTPRRGLYNVSAYLMRLDVTLLAWPVPGLVLVVGAMALQRRATRWDLLLVSALAALLVGYWAYWGEGRSLGPRFLFTIAPVFLIFVARFPALLRDHAPGVLTRRAAIVLVPVWLLAAWLSPPLRAQPFGVWTLAQRTREHDLATPLVRRAVAERRLTNAVVFVQDGWHARLAARLRALGTRPFMAQRIVSRYDACLLQQLLDSAERTPALSGRQTQFVFAALDGAPAAVPVPGLSALEQIALTPGAAPTPACAAELRRLRSNGVDFARFLPLQQVDASGALAGDIVYARDYGHRNELLRERFGNRAWYSVRVEPGERGPGAVLEEIRKK